MTCIKYFEIAGEVIESNISRLASMKGVSRDDAYCEVLSHLKNNNQEWREPARSPRIHYRKPECRVAYLYNTAPPNANLIENALSRSQDLLTYLQSVQMATGRVRVCAFGGGPGTELLGIAKWAERSTQDCLLETPLCFHFLVLDRVREWAESWSDIQDAMEARLRATYGQQDSGWPLRILRGNFCSLDFTKPGELENWVGIFAQDLYVVSYVLSEIHEDMEGFADFTTEIVRHAPQGARFLFADRNQSQWKSAVKSLASKAGLRVGPITVTESLMNWDEDKTDLGRIYADLSPLWSPRLSWNAFWVVGTKI